MKKQNQQQVEEHKSERIDLTNHQELNKMNEWTELVNKIFQKCQKTILFEFLLYQNVMPNFL